jgi:AraC-like DNA-binding protein
MLSPIPGSRLYAEALKTQLALHLLWNYSSLPRQDQKRAERLTDPRLRRVVAYIRSSLGSEVSLEALAELANLSPNYFLSAFRRATGKTPHRYLTEQRVAKACELLHNPHRSIVEVSLAVGFSSQSHLTTVFRRVLNTTPAAYREEVLGRVTQATDLTSPRFGNPPESRDNDRGDARIVRVESINDGSIERPVTVAGPGPSSRRRSAMVRTMRLAAVLTVLLTAGVEARAQYGYGYGYGYPAGYAGYGWGGWGSTRGGSLARGLGVFSMGRGVYNLDTAQTRSINTNTVMRWNNFLAVASLCADLENLGGVE